MFRSLRDRFDPLDREILERAFDATLSAVKYNVPAADFASDEGLKAILRRELIEIACFHGVSDPETLRDVLLARLPQIRPALSMVRRPQGSDDQCPEPLFATSFTAGSI